MSFCVLVTWCGISLVHDWNTDINQMMDEGGVNDMDVDDSMYENQNKRKRLLKIKCPYCTDSFTSKKSLRKHLKDIHRDQASNNRGHSCQYCNFSSRWKNSLKRHISRRHKIPRTLNKHEMWNVSTSVPTLSNRGTYKILSSLCKARGDRLFDGNLKDFLKQALNCFWQELTCERVTYKVESSFRQSLFILS